ncbi:MAG: DUF7793 family protein [Bacteroidia bacterium]
MSDKLKTKEFPLAILEFDQEKNILFYRVKQGIVVDINEMNEMLRDVEEFMGQKKHYALIDFGASLMSTTEARKIYADSQYIQKHRIADAFLVKSLAVRLVANFFIKATKPKIPTKLFTEESSALAWLIKFQEGTG